MKKSLVITVEITGDDATVTMKMSPPLVEGEFDARASIGIAVAKAIKECADPDFTIDVTRNAVPADGPDPAHSASPEAKQ